MKFIDRRIYFIQSFKFCHVVHVFLLQALGDSEDKF
jgi:hypothetical protein